jgi:beta-glucosidase
VSRAEGTIGQLVSKMTLAEKVGQMVQVSNEDITPSEVADHAIGSVLSGGNGNPDPNSPDVWADMVGAYAEAASDTRLGIPLVYGVDAVHGHSNVRGATVFPHNIALGAIGDEDLVRRIGEATATEMMATGVRWAFAPSVAVPHDIRWGRTYEGYGRDPSLVERLGAACVAGLQHDRDGSLAVLACPKHFVGDGGAAWGTVSRYPWTTWWDGWSDTWQIDQGDLRASEDDLRRVHLTPYEAAIRAGARTVMASYSSWNGTKLHAHRDLLTGVLKQELGFTGLVVSDWMGVDQLDPDYGRAVVAAVNAGVDMVMAPVDFREFIAVTMAAVADGVIPMERVDDAVRRILRVKSSLHSDTGRVPEPPPLGVVGCDEHRALAAEAARRSAVLLKNDGVLPLPRAADTVEVAGPAADDIGLQCGGWTVGWQGGSGPTTPGTTLLDALRASGAGGVSYDADGRFADHPRTGVGIVCIAESPYAEGPGDCAEPTVSDEDRAVFARMRARCERVVLVVYSGRPLVIPDLISSADAVIAAWLPGSEATELPDLLFGMRPFEGRLPQPWPASPSDLGDPSAPGLYPVGHGLALSWREGVRADSEHGREP